MTQPKTILYDGPHDPIFDIIDNLRSEIISKNEDAEHAYIAMQKIVDEVRCAGARRTQEQVYRRAQKQVEWIRSKIACAELDVCLAKMEAELSQCCKEYYQHSVLGHTFVYGKNGHSILIRWRTEHNKIISNAQDTLKRLKCWLVWIDTEERRERAILERGLTSTPSDAMSLTNV